MQTDWYFPPNHGGEESGLNDAGIEFFRTAGSLARETIQNSGDAADPNHQGPVRVEIELLWIPKREIPQVERLEQTIRQCRDYMHSLCPSPEVRAQNGEAEFARAIGILTNGDIPVLRIGDYGTTGLLGSESDPMSPWYRLIKRQGTASMHGAGGGTFGIGQRAPFSHSALRTVYYSTLLANGSGSLIGKSILSTFKDANGVKCRPVGYWGLLHSEPAVFVEALTNGATMPQVFQRTEVGTDLFIMGFTEEGWRKETTWAVLRHFFAAILAGRIVVDVKEQGKPTLRIDSQSLPGILDKEIEDARAAAGGRKSELEDVEAMLGTTRHFVTALNTPHDGRVFKQTIEKLGEVQLHLTMSDQAPSRVAYMRKPRILVFDKRQKQLKDYAAVFICETDEGNRQLAALEDPSHMTWDRSRAKGGDRILKAVNAFVRDALRAVMEKDREEAQDIPDLARFLPEEGEGNRQQAKGTEQLTGKTVRQESALVRVPEGKIKAYLRPKPKPKPETPEPADEGGAPGEGEGVLGGGGVAEGGEGSGSGGGGGELPGAGQGKDGNEGGKLRSLRPGDVGFRSYFDKDRGCICVVLTTRRKGIGDIVLTAVGEDSSYDLAIQSAKDADSGAYIAVSGGTLRDVVLEKDARRRILVSMEGDQHLALSGEVRHGR